MADMSSYLRDDDEENPDEDDFQVGGFHEGAYPPGSSLWLDMYRYTSTQEDCLRFFMQDCLPPVVRLEKYLCDPNFNRQMVGRAVLETLRGVADCPADVAAVARIIAGLAGDDDVTVRTEIAEQLPHIALLCQNDRENLHYLVPETLLPIVIRFLADPDNQVRKTAQSTLLVLLEQGLVDMDTVEEKVCPVVLMLTEKDNVVEYQTGAVSLMIKMAPLVGRDITERLLLPRFVALCSSNGFYARKACASNFCDFCAVVGNECTENILLPRFVKLCADEVWGVRKACAEVFISVACSCSLATRKSTLAPVFAALLADESRWVRMLVFQQLGPFISTFANEGAVAGPTGDDCASGSENRLVIGSDDRLLKSSNVEKVEHSGVPWWEGCGLSRGYGATNPPSEPPPEPPSVPPPDPPSAPPQQISENSSSLESVSLNGSPLLVSGDPSPLPNDHNGLSCDTFIKSAPEHPEKPPPPEDPPPEPPYLGQKNVHSDVPNDGSVWNNDGIIWNKRTYLCQRVEEIPSIEILNKHSSEVNWSKVNGDNVLDCSHSPPRGNQVEESTSRGRYHIHVDGGLAPFNTFQYWRMPIPELELDISLNDQLKPAAVTVKARVQDDRHTFASELSVDMDIDKELDHLATQLEESVRTEDSPAVQAQIGTAAVAVVSDSDRHTTTVLASSVQKSVVMVRPESTSDIQAFACSKTPLEMSSVQLVPELTQSEEPQQDIVPQVLVDQFVSMTRPDQVLNVDGDITHHCAFSIPAVALTLGRRHWGLIRGAYETLASHMQWKVRRTVASSIHELARILGEDIATRDLVPIFNGFIKDLDEVRIGMLRHLAEFLKLLRPQDRDPYLSRLEEFHSTDNTFDWRFRHELAHQMLLAIELFPPAEVCRYMGPLTLALLVDRVAHVRRQALALASALVHQMSPYPHLLRPLVSELEQQLAHSTLWSRRQTYAMLCAQVVADRSVDGEVFSRDWLPPLAALSTDRVANVRLVVARTLARIADTPNFLLDRSEQVLEVALSLLRDDCDRDVRFFTAQKEL